MTVQRKKVERGEGESNQMSIKILESSDRFIRFSINGITPSVANSIRRTLVSDIPKLAIDKVIIHHGQIRDKEGNVYDSSLPLFDEMVAHRLALIPIKTDLNINFRDQCSCNGVGCPLCTVSFSINKLGPALVTSGDIQPVSNPDILPTDLEIPIVKLGKKQAMLVTAEAIMGRAKDHAKWQATSGVAYKYHREFSVEKENFERWVEIKEKCPKSVLKEDKNSIVFTDDFPCKLSHYLFDEPSVKIKEDDTEFIFKFETDGSLKAMDVLEYTLRRLPQRLDVLHESIVTTD